MILGGATFYRCDKRSVFIKASAAEIMLIRAPNRQPED
jgi:hypothetical protein